MKCTFFSKISLAVLCALSQASVVEARSWKKPSFSPASFVPPAAPTAVQAKPGSKTCFTTEAEAAAATVRATRTHHQVSRPYGVVLEAKKKGGGPAAPAKKIQVKMLKHVAGTGRMGEVVMVTPAFFQNMLRPSKSAVLISDEEVQQEKGEVELEEKLRIAKAKELQERIQDLTLNMKMKAGPEGHLFGGIHAKNIMEELKKKVPDDFIDSKGVSLKSVTDESGQEMKADIKHVGDYVVTLSLDKDKDIAASFTISVKPMS